MKDFRNETPINGISEICVNKNFDEAIKEIKSAMFQLDKSILYLSDNIFQTPKAKFLEVFEDEYNLFNYKYSAFYDDYTDAVIVYVHRTGENW